MATKYKLPTEEECNSWKAAVAADATCLGIHDWLLYSEMDLGWQHQYQWANDQLGAPETAE